MSAESGFKELDLALSRTKLDRAAHLRLDKNALDEMWLRAEIAQISGDRFRIMTDEDGRKISLELLNATQTKEEIKIVNDQFGSPTYTIDLSEAIIKVIKERGQYRGRILRGF